LLFKFQLTYSVILVSNVWFSDSTFPFNTRFSSEQVPSLIPIIYVRLSCCPAENPLKNLHCLKENGHGLSYVVSKNWPLLFLIFILLSHQALSICSHMYQACCFMFFPPSLLHIRNMSLSLPVNNPMSVHTHSAGTSPLKWMLLDGLGRRVLLDDFTSVYTKFSNSNSSILWNSLISNL